MAQRQKAAPLGTHGDSEQGSSMKGLLLLATPPVAQGSAPPEASGQVFLPRSRSQAAQSPSSPTGCAATSLCHQGFPLQQMSALPDKDGQAQPF